MNFVNREDREEAKRAFPVAIKECSSDEEKPRMDEERSVTTAGGSETPSMKSLNLSTAGTQLMNNLDSSRASSSAISSTKSPGVTSPTSLASKNALAASRLLRIRNARGSRAKAAQQLMERMVPTRPGVVDSTESSSAVDSQVGVESAMRNRHRHRGTGGAYAKIMMQRPSPLKDAGLEENDNEEERPMSPVSPGNERKGIVTSRELEGIRMQAVTEFSKGPETNLRYHRRLDELTVDKVDDNDNSETNVPSTLNRSEIFHENAAAAVMALLTPRQRGGDHISVFSSSSNLDEAGLRVTSSKKGLTIRANLPTVSAFRSPNSTSGVECVSSHSTNALDVSYEGAIPRSPITAPILSAEAGRILEHAKTHMKDPSNTLGDLLTAIATPDDRVMDRGFMVRRKNACGALKVLTATVSNRRTICWTIGVLPTLTSVLEDADDGRPTEAFPDHFTRAEYFEARKRAVASLVHLATPKDNRIPIFHTPGLIHAVCGVIAGDTGESRQGCCALVGYLTKTQDNRLLMAQVPGLVNALCGVIAPSVAKQLPMEIMKKKKYHWDDDEDDDSSEDDDYGDSFSNDFANTSMFSDASDRYTIGTRDTRGTSFRTDDDSDVTPRMSPSQLSSMNASSTNVEKVAENYDRDPNKFLHAARKNVFAALLHLIKEKDNAVSKSGGKVEDCGTTD